MHAPRGSSRRIPVSTCRRTEVHLLVTGAAGFLGKALLAAIPRGTEVTTLDIVPLPGSHIQCDLTDRGDLNKSLAGVSFDAVIHLAGLASGAGDLLFRGNVQGTENLYGTVNCRRFVSASSCSVYGAPESSDGSVSEEHPLKPAGDYGRSMVAREKAAPSAVHLRLFNVTGPGQNKGMLVPDMAAGLARIALGADTEPICSGPLHTERDYVDVSDAARAFLAAAECPSPAHCMNIGSGNSFSGTHVFETLCSAMGISPRIEFLSMPAGVARIKADVTLAKRSMGWAPRVSFKDSIMAVAADWLKRTAMETGEGS
jgi:nucleoside-diphosphate-sugar epimerase